MPTNGVNINFPLSFLHTGTSKPREQQLLYSALLQPNVEKYSSSPTT